METKYDIFPLRRLPVGWARVVLCHRKGCREEFLTPANSTYHSICQTAKAANWLCDTSGFALCPEHKEEKNSALTPAQRRAAYMRIMFEKEADRLYARQRERDFLNGAKPPIKVKEKKVDRVVTSGPTLEVVGAPRMDVRHPTPTERRRIFSYLDENYDIDDKQYIGDVTDEVASRALGLPRAWVADIRQNFFGPEGNENKAKLAPRVAEYIEKCKLLEEDAFKLAQRAIELTKIGQDLQRAVGLPTLPIEPVTISKPAPSEIAEAVDFEAARTMHLNKAGKPSRIFRLSEKETLALTESVKSVLKDATKPMSTVDIETRMHIQIPGATAGARKQRLLKILHSSDFVRTGPIQRAYWSLRNK